MGTNQLSICGEWGPRRDIYIGKIPLAPNYSPFKNSRFIGNINT